VERGNVTAASYGHRGIKGSNVQNADDCKPNTMERGAIITRRGWGNSEGVET